MIIKILIFVLMIMVVLFMYSQSDRKDNVINESVCSRSFIDNCQYYYDCWGALKSCGPQDRYDENTRSCRHYYLTNCGNRYNPPHVTNSELCNAYANGYLTVNMFPQELCNQYMQCINNNARIFACVNQLYSIPDARCESKENVDCGSRLTGVS
nr:ADOR66 [Darna trima granulovirus]